MTDPYVRIHGRGRKWRFTEHSLAGNGEVGSSERAFETRDDAVLAAIGKHRSGVTIFDQHGALIDPVLVRALAKRTGAYTEGGRPVSLDERPLTAREWQALDGGKPTLRFDENGVVVHEWNA